MPTAAPLAAMAVRTFWSLLVAVAALKVVAFSSAWPVVCSVEGGGDGGEGLLLSVGLSRCDFGGARWAETRSTSIRR